jgi:hypothetical protein
LIRGQAIVIIAPPPEVAYPFILDVEGYPQQIINFFIVIVRAYCSPFVHDFIRHFYQGLFWLRYREPNTHRPFKGKNIAYLCKPPLTVWL